jgi:hypothetical protein
VTVTQSSAETSRPTSITRLIIVIITIIIMMSYTMLPFLALTLLCITKCIVAPQTTTEHAWTYSDFIPETYDKTQPPDREPINVSIAVKVAQLLVVNEADQSYTIDIHYTQKWPDYRLKFPPHNATLPLSVDWKNKLWMPSVFLTNSMNPNMLQMSPLFLEIEANTSRLVSTTRQVVKLRCLMDLGSFPMDTQTCPIEFTLCEYILLAISL